MVAVISNGNGPLRLLVFRLASDAGMTVTLAMAAAKSASALVASVVKVLVHIATGLPPSITTIRDPIPVKVVVSAGSIRMVKVT